LGIESAAARREESWLRLSGCPDAPRLLYSFGCERDHRTVHWTGPFFAGRRCHPLGPAGRAMRLRSAQVLFAGMVAAVFVFLACGAALSSSSGRGDAQPASQPAKITIDYPLDGSVFPPEITPPTVLWHDPAESAKRWVVEVSFAGHSDGMRMEVAGEHLRMGEIDPAAGPGRELTPEEAATRTWKPDTATWEKIKRLSVKTPARITITGFAEDNSKTPVSAGSVTISTSVDPVGAPIFTAMFPSCSRPRTRRVRSSRCRNPLFPSSNGRCGISPSLKATR